LDVIGGNEITSDFSNGECTSISKPDARADAVTYLNYANNDLVSCNGLAKYTKLQRLNLHNNDLKSLKSLKHKYMRWLNVRSNNIKELFDNRTELPCLEWVDASDNDITSCNVENLPKLKYLNISSNNIVTLKLGNPPNLKWVDASNNDIKTVISFGYTTTHIDLSSNDLSHIRGLEDYEKLEYVNLSNNDLNEIATLLKLLELPSLQLLDISNNNLSKMQISQLRQKLQECDKDPSVLII